MLDTKMNDLLHHGVKGQKWGVRRERVSSGKSKRAQRKAEKLTRKEDAIAMRKQTASVAKSKMSVYKMSDSELQSKIKRMQLESQYMSLADSRSAYHQSSGQKFIKSVMGTKPVSDAAVNKIGQTALNAGLTKAATASGNPSAMLAASVIAQANKPKNK